MQASKRQQIVPAPLWNPLMEINNAFMICLDLTTATMMLVRRPIAR
jgi:hypothetical protein